MKQVNMLKKGLKLPYLSASATNLDQLSIQRATSNPIVKRRFHAPSLSLDLSSDARLHGDDEGIEMCNSDDDDELGAGVTSPFGNNSSESQ